MQLKISINIRVVYNMKDSSIICMIIIKGKTLFSIVVSKSVGDGQYQNKIKKKNEVKDNIT